MAGNPTMRETLKPSVVKELVRIAGEVAIARLKESGIPLEVGQVNGDGNLITKEYLTKLKGVIKTVLWNDLMAKGTVVEEEE